MGDVKQYLVSLHQAAVGCQIDSEAVKSILSSRSGVSDNSQGN
jgi:hypothetical protein